MTANGYRIGDRVRVIGGDDPPVGTFGRVVRMEPDDYGGSLPVQVESEHDGDTWWPELHEIEPAASTASSHAGPSVVEQMARAHGIAWARLTAKTPREWLAATGWSQNDAGDWQHESGPLVELVDGELWPYNFEVDGSVYSMCTRTLRAFAALLDEVTP